MTSEVCVMNRLAIVLAADSASTVTQHTDEGYKERYFKGANKIFQLSDYHPVGVMIFDSASILNVPWEIIIKSFRADLKDQSFERLEDYAKRFFDFLDGNMKLFPTEVQHNELLSAARNNALELIFSVDRAIKEQIKNNVIKEIESEIIELGKSPKISGISEEFEEECLKDFIDKLSEDLELLRASIAEFLPDDLSALAEYGLMKVLRQPSKSMGSTGLVFAGFGDHDIFPSMREYLSQGYILGKHVVTVTDGGLDVNHYTSAHIKAFAQTSMSDTFTLGLSQDVFISVMQAVGEGLEHIENELIKIHGDEDCKAKNIPAIIDSARKAISSTVLTNAREQHADPMRNVLSFLPIDEMAELAETLINLQSLKEKVTRPSETVGGPVDVAVITKSEGLVWIKRKHYFNLDINARYVQRRAKLLS